MGRIGRYELGAVLGRGGAGWVHASELVGPDGQRRPVAVKVLHAGGDALRREARLGGLLRHRNLVDVYEVGEHEGVWFCAMERCAGSLAAHLPLPPRAVVEVGLAVCAALQYAHDELGLVHLDLKPENLLFADDGTVKVADLGIARARGFDTHTKYAFTTSPIAPEARAVPRLVSREVRTRTLRGGVGEPRPLTHVVPQAREFPDEVADARIVGFDHLDRGGQRR